MKNLMIKFIAVGSLALFASDAMAQASEVRLLRVTNPSQSIGIRIGDVLQRQVEFEVKPPYQLSRNTLPAKGANRNGIELADIKIVSAQREQKTVYTIMLSYQVFAAAHAPGTMQLPAEEFALTGGQQALSIKVPVWRFWFSPLVAASIDVAKESLQPQYKPSLVAIGDHQLRLMGFLGLLIVGLAGLIYINADGRWLPFMNGAFAQAHRNLKKLAKKQGQEKQALYYLHQAFNQVYGANLFSREIPQFVQQHPEFGRLRTEIESFFERSNQALFAGFSHDGEAFISALVLFSKNLRDCERGAS